MGSTVSDSSGTPDNGSAREREREGGGGGGGGLDGRTAQALASGPAPASASGPVSAPGPCPCPAPASGPVSAPAPASGPVSADGAGSDGGPDSVVDLVLDLVPGEDEVSALGATSASVSVPAMGAAAVPAMASVTAPAGDPEPSAIPVPVLVGLALSGAAPAADPVPRTTRTTRTTPGAEQSGDAERRHAVIATERTASIPVHLLFREDPEHTDAASLPAGVLRRGAADGHRPAAGLRRPPAPRGPQVRPSTRPAPVGDPRLAERSGPALPGWVALLAGLAGIAAGGAVLWSVGALPVAPLARLGIGSRPYDGIGLGAWAALTALGAAVLLALGGLSRGRVGYAWVLTLFGEYRGSVRRTGLMWISPLLLRRRVDVRLRHWRSEPLPAVDANGTALRVVVLVVWRIKDTVRATLGVADHEAYLREQVEAAMARVLSQLPADAFHEDAHTLRNAEAVGDALTRMLKADCAPVGIEVYSAQPTGIEYAPEVAAAMQRRRIAAIDAKHRDSVLTSVVDAVDDTVNRLTARGIVELDDYERKSLVKDLTVAFYTGRSGGEGA